MDADTFVLTLPMAEKQELLALLVFIGGLSAATGMVIVETIALSTMVCNDLVMPVLLRLKGLRLNERRDLTGLLLGIRRGAIVLILLLGYLYFKLAGRGLRAGVDRPDFVRRGGAVRARPCSGGIFWKGGTRRGAFCGLARRFSGVAVHAAAALASPNPDGCRSAFLEHGPVRHRSAQAAATVRPGRPGPDHALPVLEHARQYRRLRRRVAACTRERGRAQPGDACSSTCFKHSGEPPGAPFWRGTASAPDLHRPAGALPRRRIGRRRVPRVCARAAASGRTNALAADANLVHYVEMLLAGAIGAASAHIMVASAVKEEALTIDEVREILDEASQVVVYSHRLEQKSRELERATEELRGANERLKELDRLKDDFVSTVTHELRTPLTSIRAFSEILLDNPISKRPSARASSASSSRRASA